MNGPAVAWALEQMPGDVHAKLVLVQMAAEAQDYRLGGPPWWWDGSPYNLARITAACGLTLRQMSWALAVLDDSSLARPQEIGPGRVEYELCIYRDRRWVDEAVKNHVPVPAPMRRAVFERDGHQCVRCGSTERLHADHIYPRWLGGLNLLENLQTLCAICNSLKGTRIERADGVVNV